MHIELFSLCDAATVDSGGKLNILGAFDTITAVNFPVNYPFLAIALRIRFEKIEEGEHRILLNFVDLDGKHLIAPMHSTINIRFPLDQKSGAVNSVLNIQMLRFEKAGEYAIDLAIDGKKEATLPLYIKTTVN